MQLGITELTSEGHMNIDPGFDQHRQRGVGGWVCGLVARAPLLKHTSPPTLLRTWRALPVARAYGGAPYETETYIKHVERR